jgi:hypothetical protein
LLESICISSKHKQDALLESMVLHFFKVQTRCFAGKYGNATKHHQILWWKVSVILQTQQDAFVEKDLSFYKSKTR